MSGDMKNAANTVPPQKSRGPQKRTEQTKETILATATEMFATVGYDGVSVRALEVEAGVQRGAVSYHFDGKEALWKAMFDRLMERFGSHFDPLAQTVRDMDESAATKALMAALIRFSAETPEFNRLMMQEGGRDTWRMNYVVSRISEDRFRWIARYSGMYGNPHDYYIMVGAATFVFGVEHECRQIFGVDPMTDEFIREHAARVAEFLLIARDSKRGEQ